MKLGAGLHDRWQGLMCNSQVTYYALLHMLQAGIFQVNGSNIMFIGTTIFDKYNNLEKYYNRCAIYIQCMNQAQLTSGEDYFLGL